MHHKDGIDGARGLRRHYGAPANGEVFGNTPPFLTTIKIQLRRSEKERNSLKEIKQNKTHAIGMN